MSMNLSEKFWPEIKEYLKNSQKIIIPVGSTEQHGPTGIIGIDYLTSWEISKKVGEKINMLVTPPLCFGMALHHMGFPGTMSLKPSTYVTVISELVESVYQHGFKQVNIVNGHGGNIAPITTAISQILDGKNDLEIKLINWWHLPEVTDYEKEVFGDQNGFHATCGEISVTMHTHPDAYKKLILEKNYEFKKFTYNWPMNSEVFKKNFPDGRMFSNPYLANSTHGEKIFSIAIDAIIRRLQ